MVVVDASAVIEFLLDLDSFQRLAEIVSTDASAPFKPKFFIRSGARGFEEARALVAVDDFLSLPIERYEHRPLVLRIWQLRHAITAYDAAYVALAEQLDVPLITRDLRLSRSSGHAARIEYID